MGEGEKPMPVEVRFDGRSTGMGAYTQYHIFSLRQKKEIPPHRTERSRTGRHWVDYWYLLPAKYFVCWHDISNSGKHYCGYGLLVVSENGYKIEDWKGTIPEFAVEKLCECIKLKLGIIQPSY